METSMMQIKIGFHYHIPVFLQKDGSIKTASFFGAFLDSMAQNCTELFGFLYSALENEKEKCNYTIKAKNFQWVNLGPHSSIPTRYLRMREFIKLFEQHEPLIDIFLIL